MASWREGSSLRWARGIYRHQPEPADGRECDDFRKMWHGDTVTRRVVVLQPYCLMEKLVAPVTFWTIPTGWRLAGVCSLVASWTQDMERSQAWLYLLSWGQDSSMRKWFLCWSESLPSELPVVFCPFSLVLNWYWAPRHFWKIFHPRFVAMLPKPQSGPKGFWRHTWCRIRSIFDGFLRAE